MDVQANLLFRSLRPLNYSNVIEAVNALVSVPDMKLEMTTPSSDGSVLFTNPDYHVTVSIRPEPFPVERLEAAISAPITQVKDYDFLDAISVHRLHVNISVGDGPVQVNEQIREWMGRMGTQSAAKPYAIERKLVMLNAFVQQIVDHDTPEAVYWAQSDMIFSPDEIMEARDMPFPLPLVVRPTPTFENETASGQGRVGVRLENSETFIGRTLETEPSNLPFGEVVGITMWLMSERIKGRLSLEHGAAMETPGFPTLYLRHEAPDQKDPNGRIIVTQVSPQAEVEIPDFSFATATWQTARRSDQGHEHIASTAYSPEPQQVHDIQPAAAPAPVAAQPVAMAAPSPLHMAAQPQLVAVAPVAAPAPAPVPQPVQQEMVAAPAPVQQEVPAPAAEPRAMGWGQQPAQMNWPNGGQTEGQTAQPGSMASAVTSAAATPRRSNMAKGTNLVPNMDPKASLKANVPDHHAVDVGATLVAKAEEAEAKTKKGGMGNILPMRAIASVAAIGLVVAAALVVAPKFLGEDFDLASLSNKTNAGVTVLSGPRLPGQN